MILGEDGSSPAIFRVDVEELEAEAATLGAHDLRAVGGARALHLPGGDQGTDRVRPESESTRHVRVSSDVVETYS